MWRRQKILASLQQELETIALFDRVHDFTTEHDSAHDRAYAARQIRRSQVIEEIGKLSEPPGQGQAVLNGPAKESESDGEGHSFAGPEQAKNIPNE